MIAVIVPIYNTEKYLRETIDSVIARHCLLQSISG